MPGNHPKRGVWLALLAALLFGIGTPLVKLRFAAVEPVLLAALISLGSGVGVALLTRTSWRIAPLFQGRNRPLFGGAVVSGGIAAPFLLVWGISHAPGSAASLLLNLEAVFTALIAWGTGRERLGPRMLLGLVLITAGGGVVSAAGGGPSGEGGHFAAGLALAGSCLAWAIDNNCTVRLRGVAPAQFTLWKGVFSGAVLLAVCAWAKTPVPGAGTVGEALLLGTCCHGLALLCFVMALGFLGAGRATAYFATAPFVGAIAAILILGDPVTPRLLVAAALMVLGLIALFSEKHPVD